jgi:hypothetical protein
MNIVTTRGWRQIGLAMLLLFGFCRPAWAGAASEEKFQTLQIGTHVYTNVTVTTKAKNYIFVMHATGMLNVKLSELTPDVLHELGYKTPEEAEAAKRTTNVLAVAVAKIPAVGRTSMKNLEQSLWSRVPASQKQALTNPRLLGPMLWAMAGLYFFFSFCASKICKKTGVKDGGLAWVPILQLFPLLKAAGMSPAWFIAFLVPVFNLFALLVWSFRIAEARRLASWVALLMIIPGLNILGLICLTFAEGAPEQKKMAFSSPQLMSLETA